MKKKLAEETGEEFTDASLARHIGTTQTSIHRWRTGTSVPSNEMLRRVSELLTVPMITLLIKTEQLTEDEVNPKLVQKTDLSDFSTNQLMSELKRRVH
ncbi:hypothetical protein CJ179_38280 [Rhodococcus sp. ACS1]|nr:hypothetical protein CJ179_38280 [Rhodococcus sp. ACS1]